MQSCPGLHDGTGVTCQHVGDNILFSWLVVDCEVKLHQVHQHPSKPARRLDVACKAGYCPVVRQKSKLPINKVVAELLGDGPVNGQTFPDIAVQFLFWG